MEQLIKIAIFVAMVRVILLAIDCLPQRCHDCKRFLSKDKFEGHRMIGHGEICATCFHKRQEELAVERAELGI